MIECDVQEVVLNCGCAVTQQGRVDVKIVIPILGNSDLLFLSDLHDHGTVSVTCFHGNTLHTPFLVSYQQRVGNKVVSA